MPNIDLFRKVGKVSTNFNSNVCHFLTLHLRILQVATFWITWKIQSIHYSCQISLKGYCISRPTPKLACFVPYLKIINTFLKNMYASCNSKLPKELKNSIKI